MSMPIVHHVQFYTNAEVLLELQHKIPDLLSRQYRHHNLLHQLVQCLLLEVLKVLEVLLLVGAIGRAVPPHQVELVRLASASPWSQSTAENAIGSSGLMYAWAGSTRGNLSTCSASHSASPLLTPFCLLAHGWLPSTG